MSTKPIATAPTDDEERILHLWCPELGSWEAGVFFESDWRAHVNLDLVLKPSHWREPPPPPADSPDELPHQSAARPRRITPRCTDRALFGPTRPTDPYRPSRTKIPAYLAVAIKVRRATSVVFCGLRPAKGDRDEAQHHRCGGHAPGARRTGGAWLRRRHDHPQRDRHPSPGAHVRLRPPATGARGPLNEGWGALLVRRPEPPLVVSEPYQTRSVRSHAGAGCLPWIACNRKPPIATL